MTRRRTTTITLSPATRQRLAHQLRCPTLPAGQARRVRAVLLRAAGLAVAAIAQRIGVTPRTVYAWLAQWQQGAAARGEKEP